MKKYFYAIAVLSAAIPLFGKIEMPKVFSDNMVLQRNADAKIWGTSEPNATVEVQFKGQKKSAKADGKGNWSLRLDKMPADKTPNKMTVFENGKADKTIENILVGEVWVLGGQSNMEWSLRATTDAKAAIKRADSNKNIRYFKQDGQAYARTPQKDSPEGSQWQCCSSKTAVGWSAVGYYFAEKVAEKLDVPVGLLYTALGATQMIMWVEESAVEKNPQMKAHWERFKKELAAYDEAAYQKELAKWNAEKAEYDKQNAILKKQGKPLKWFPWDRRRPPSRVSPKAAFFTPVFNYNAKVAPLRGYTVRGTLWYQGEGDAGSESVEKFESQMKLVISEWRKYFDNPEMPFIMAQLSSFADKSNWAYAREAQLKTANDVPHVFTIPTLDRGMEKDIHPKDKTTVGVRMANMALSQVYGEKCVKPFAPQFKSAEYDGDTATVRIETNGVPVSLKGEAKGFEVRSNGKWGEASATLGGCKLSVKSKDGSKIDGVRYLWESCPLDEICIYNADGLPLFPFSNDK